MNCPHGVFWYECEERECVAEQKHKAGDLAQCMRHLVARLSRCDHVPQGVRSIEEPDHWCGLCGAVRVAPDRWVRPGSTAQANVLDREWQSLGVDLGEVAEEDAPS
jgi:hypothetical protein